ncbi:MAG: helix-turn-helix transcriptional regulator [Acidobacteriota bacterium]|nr:helix-turn-helix transcriptional regulator [Acidobacteriota bacterium]
MEVALALLGTKGAQQTTMDDIAGGGGVSRATLYQYFESKEQIFAELVEESGAALLRVLRRVGPLGADDAGFAAVQAWLADWTVLYSRYSEVFAQWSAIEALQRSRQSMLAGWMTNYVKRLTPLLGAADPSVVEPPQLAIAVWALFERSSFSMTRQSAGPQQLSDLAVVVQLMLFPDTPVTVLGSSMSAHPLPRGLEQAAAERPTVEQASEQAAAGPPTDEQKRADAGGSRRHGGGPEALRTAERILDVGGRLFTIAGFHAVSVEQVARAAQVGRGTFYKYFDNKADLLGVLSVECSERMTALGEALSERMANEEPRRALGEWLEEFLAFHRVYAGVWRVWSDEPALVQGIVDRREAARDALRRGLIRLVGAVARPYPLTDAAVAEILCSLLQRFPDQATGTAFACEPEESALRLRLLIERAFLNIGSSEAR